MHEVRQLLSPTGETRPNGQDGPPPESLPESLLDGLLSGSLPDPPGPLESVERALQAHRDHRRSWYGDLIGPLGVPATAAAHLADALRSEDHALRMVLIGVWPAEVTATLAGVRVAQQDLDELMRAARAHLLDDDRIELAVVELTLTSAASPAEAAEQTLSQLDVSAPAWLRIPARRDWIAALDVIAQDGAEHVALVLPGGLQPGEPAPAGTQPAPGSHAELAAVLRSVVQHGLRFCIVDPPGALGVDLVTSGTAYGLLNLLCATGAALGGADQDEIAVLLGESSPEVMTAAARTIDEAAAAGVRRVLDRVACTSVRAMVTDLEATGLIRPEVA